MTLVTLGSQSHALGQALFCTDGAGLVASRDGTVIRLTPGDTVWPPPGEEHWHGAGAMMSHLAMLEGLEDGDGLTQGKRRCCWPPMRLTFTVTAVGLADCTS